MHPTSYHFATVNGRQIFYREAGSASHPTIVLLHGFPSSSHMYRDLIPQLADRFHVQLVELAGNPVLTQYCKLIHYLVRGQIKALWSGRRDGDPPIPHDSTDAHSTVVELLAAGAVHAASEHWRRHLDDVHAALAQRWDLNSLLEPPQ